MAETTDQPGPQEQQELLGVHGTRGVGPWSSEDEDQDQQLQYQDEEEDGGAQGPQQSERETLLKTQEASELDEDEGFGDWSQRPEHRRQNWGATADGGDPPQDDSPEGQQEEGRPPQPGCGDQEDTAIVGLEGVCLCSEPPLDTDPAGPPGTVQAHEHEEGPSPRTPSPSGLQGGDQPGSPPLSPCTKIVDRTESLNRCVERSNSVKKSQPGLPISKIDGRLEQYTQAIETAVRTPRLARQPSIELPSMAVASTKSLWESGEVQAQSASRPPPCKDIVAGDLSKKGLWEQKGAPPASSTAKTTPSGKRYKFVATGHGKYEKVPVD